MPNIGKSVDHGTFKGLNNVLPAHNSTAGYLKELVNLDVDKAGNLSKRKGFLQKDAADYHSLWANEEGTRMYAVRDGVINSIDDQGVPTSLGLTVNSNKVDFRYLDGDTYFVSADYSGKIDSSGSITPWGLPIPNLSVTLSAISGTLPKGYYQVSLSYETADGRKSGSTLATNIELPANSSIVLSSIPVDTTDPDIVFVNIFCSLENGDELYRVRQVANGTTSFTISDVLYGDYQLDTFGYYPAPQGHIVEWAHGRFYIAKDNIVWFSQPFEYDYFSLRESYFYFPEKITAICPTPDGLWISADRLYYVSGKDPTSARLTEKEPFKVVEGSAVKFSGAYIFIDNTPLGYKWLCTTDRGIIVLFNDGVVLNISEQNVAIPTAHDGASGFIQEDGINRYVSLLRKKDDSQNTAIGDLVTTTVIRNGVSI